MVFLHAHLQAVYYNCVKFHKNSISSLVGVALTRYNVHAPLPPFRESIRKGVVYLWRPLDVCSWLVYFGDGMLSP
jgi:hypothetical protein